MNDFQYIGKAEIYDRPIKYYLWFTNPLRLEIDCHSSKQVPAVINLIDSLNLKIIEAINVNLYYVLIQSISSDLQTVINLVGTNDKMKTIDDIIEDYILEKLQE